MEADMIVESPYTAVGRAILEIPFGGSLNLFDEDEVYICTVVKIDKERPTDG